MVQVAMVKALLLQRHALETRLTVAAFQFLLHQRSPETPPVKGGSDDV